MPQSSEKCFSPPWLMKIRPLRLREKLFWKLYANPQSTPHLNLSFQNVPLREFSPQISLKLLSTDISHRQIAFLGYAEQLVSSRITKLANRGGILVDVGANYGYYSCLWAAQKTTNQVIAFEASPRNLSALRFNVTKNNLNDRIFIHDVALGKETGRLPFTLGPEEQSGWGGLLVDKSSDTVDVPVTTLDEFIANSMYTDIDVLKIDTEGADTWILQGAKKLLSLHKIHHIFFEENTPRMETLGIASGEAKKLLQDSGYHLKPLGKREYYAEPKKD